MKSGVLHEDKGLKTFAIVFDKNDDVRERLHAHVVVGKADGTAFGGHFLGGRVWPTLEMIVSEMPVHLRRRDDQETGLALIELAA